MNILAALDDEGLFARHFRPPASWAAWRAFLAALYALPLDPASEALYRKHTRRAAPPATPAREAWVIVGRRGGKSRIAALCAAYAAVFGDFRGVLAEGERGSLMVLAQDRRQARVVFGHVAALIDGSPLLASLVEKRTADALYLRNNVAVEVHTSSFRAVRGYTLVGVICDELAFWRDESSANPDAEVIAAVRPGLATVPGAMLIGISSPYSRRGVLWGAYRDHFGKDGDTLVWQAATREMNPSVDERVVERAFAEDPSAAAAEWDAQFRTDVESYVAREAVEAVVVPDRRELPPLPGLSYRAFVDPSGGAQDAMTLAIAHAERETAVLDLLREARPPFSPESVVLEFAEVLRRYGVWEVAGDRYSGEWCREQFRKLGIEYRVAEKPKALLYAELLPAINSGRVELLDDPKLVAQLLGLERRTSRGGRDTIDHAPRGHDDVSNAAAGAIDLILAPKPQLRQVLVW